MKSLQLGQAAPSATLQTISGAYLPLADCWQNGRAALLIFLRHLG